MQCAITIIKVIDRNNAAFKTPLKWEISQHKHGGNV